MVRVRVRWTDTNINFGKLALWRYLSLIQLDNQRQHSTLYIIGILMVTLAQSQSLSICNRSFLWVCNCNRFSCLFWPSNISRASFDFKTFTRCIAGFLVFLRPHDLRHTAANVAGDCRRSTLDCGLPTADCALSSSFFAQASPSPLPLTGIALRNATWNFYAFCIGRAGMRGACWVVRNKKGQSWSRARSSRTLFMCWA